MVSVAPVTLWAMTWYAAISLARPHHAALSSTPALSRPMMASRQPSSVARARRYRGARAAMTG